MEKARKFLIKNIVPITFLILSILGILLSGVSLKFISSELYRRVMRNTIMVLALIVPIRAGMGINFSIIIGALCSQFATIIIVDKQIYGVSGFILIVGLSILISSIVGNILGYLINKSRGREMITSLVLGLLGTSIYNLIFMVGYGTIIKPNNTAIMLNNGVGIQSMIDIFRFKEVLIEYKFIPILFIIIVTLFIVYITK
ncbi:MAG: hypothetical protein ACRCXT_08310, partial [Paraclostridium sp.]